MKVNDLSLDELRELVRQLIDEVLAAREGEEGDIRDEVVARLLADEASEDPNLSHEEAMRLAGLD